MDGRYDRQIRMPEIGTEGQRMGGKARHHGFVGKDEISQQKGEGVDPKAVDDDIGRVQHLRRGPKGQTQRHQGKGPQPPAEPVETACFKPAQQRQRHGKDPKQERSTWRFLLS